MTLSIKGNHMTEAAKEHNFTSEHVSVMKSILAAYNQVQEDTVEDRETRLYEEIRNFVSVLTLSDFETFYRNLRVMCDAEIERRLTNLRNFGSESISDPNEYAVKIFEKMQQNEKGEAFARRANLTLSEKRKAEWAARAAEVAAEQARIEELEKAEAIADMMDKAAREKAEAVEKARTESAKERQEVKDACNIDAPKDRETRAFTIKVSDSSDEEIPYAVHDVDGERSLDLISEKEVIPEVPDISVSVVEPVECPITKPVTPEDILPGYLSLDKAIEELVSKREEILEHLRNPEILEDEAAFGSLSSKVQELTRKIVAMNYQKLKDSTKG